MNFEHQTREHTSSIRVFAGWHSVEVSVIRPQHCSCIFISADAPDWALCLTNQLLLVPLPPVFAYYRGLSPDEGSSHLIDVIAQSEFAVVAVQASSERFFDTCKCDSRIEPRVPHLVAILSPVMSLVKTVGVLAILDGSGYDMAPALMAWEIIRSTDWLAVTPDPVAQLLAFSRRSSTVFVLTNEDTTRLIQDEKESFLTQPLLPAVPIGVTRLPELLCDVL